MNTERLKTLRDVIAATPDDYVDLSWWQQSGDCGTIACMLGWACEVPEFQAAGLRMEHYPGYGDAFPTLDQKFGYEAGAAFFGLDYADSAMLFCGRGCRFSTENDDRTDKQVALDRLDHLLTYGNFTAMRFASRPTTKPRYWSQP